MNRKGIILAGDSGTAYSALETERCIALSNPGIRIQWAIEGVPLLSAKARQGRRLADAEHFA